MFRSPTLCHGMIKFNLRNICWENAHIIKGIPMLQFTEFRSSSKTNPLDSRQSYTTGNNRDSFFVRTSQVSDREQAAPRSRRSSSSTEPWLPHSPADTVRWKRQKNALRVKFGEEGWQPRKRLSPDTLEGIRSLHSFDPEQYSTAVLAQHFHVSPEAVRRILKSKWRPAEDEIELRRKRWERRGFRKWTEMASQGIKPPSKWRPQGENSSGKASYESKRTSTSDWGKIANAKDKQTSSIRNSTRLF